MTNKYYIKSCDKQTNLIYELKLTLNTYLIFIISKQDKIYFPTSNDFFNIQLSYIRILIILNLKIKWKGKGINERAYDSKGNIIISCDKNYFRPLEVDNLLGNYNKAKKILKWSPKIKIDSLIKDMINYEILDLGKKND